MKLVLHIGQGKAGSTAIQDSLYAAKDELLSHGCLYPENTFIKGRHHWISPLIFDNPMRFPSVVQRMGFDKEEAKRRALDEWHHLKSQIGQHKPSHLVLSSETIFGAMSKGEVERARQHLSGFSDDIRTLAYIRSPVSRYLSLVQQKLKATATIVQPGPTHVSSVLRSYEKVFDKPVETRVFERSHLLDKDAVVDFLDWAKLPVDSGKVKSIQSNESVSSEAMAVMLELSPNRLAINQEELALKRMRFRAVLLADKDLEMPTKPKLKPEIADYIVRVSPDLLELRDAYGLEFSDVDYSLIGTASPQERPAITHIHQICEFDRERQKLLKIQAEANLEKLLNKKKNRKKSKWYRYDVLFRKLFSAIKS